MAMAVESFSIREYAARMRSVDVVKCWPFEEAEEETVETTLPPITIKKFRWWFDELELVRSNCAGYGESSRKKLQEEGEISDLESETIESMRMKRVEKMQPVKGKLKLKNKPPKKRSIVELFAVSPQVERVNSDDDNSNNEEDSDNDSVQERGRLPNSKLVAIGNVGSKCKNKRKVKKKGIASMLKKQKKVVKNLKKKVNPKTKKMEKNTVLDVRNAKKGKSSRLKLISSVDFIASPKCSTHDTGIISDISSHKKQPRTKCLASEKKSKILKTTKLLGKNQKLVLPVRGILKNQTEVFPAEKSTSSISQDVGKVNQCNTQHVNKHVTFSVNNDVLGPRRKANSTLELELENFCNLSSDVTGSSKVNDHTAGRGEGLNIHQMEEAEEENDNCKESEINVQPVTGMQFSTRCHDADASNFLVHHVNGQENFFNKSVALDPVALHSENLQSLEGFNRGKLHDALYTCSSPPMSQEDRIPQLATPMFGHSSDASSSNGSFVASGYFTDFLKAYPQPSTSYESILNENANCRPHFPAQITRDNYYDPSLQHQWFPHLSPKELMRTICSLPDWKSRVAISGETSINEDLIGLPLNSQGELIRLNSNINGRFDQLRDTSTVVSPCISSPMHNNVPSNLMVDQAYFRSWNGITSPADHLRMCRIEDFGRKMENIPIPSRLDTMEQHYGARRSNIMTTGFDPSFYALESDMDLARMLYNRSRQDQLFRNHPGNPNHISLQLSQSTMRLMGQEFKIGGSELQKLEDREVLMDKQTIKEQHANTATEGSCIRSHDLPEFTVHPISTELKNTVIHLSETKVNPASGIVSQIMVPESTIFSQFLQSQDNIICQDGYGIGNGNMMPEIYPHFSLAGSPLSGSDKTVCQDPFLRGYKSPTASQTLVPESLFQDTSQNMSRSCIKLKNKQKPPNPSNLAFKCPFLHKDGRHIQQSWTQNSFKVMAPWWLDSRQKGSLNDYNQTYSSPASSCHDWSISGIDHQIEPSVYPTPESFCTLPSATLQNSLASSSLVHCPLLPVHPGISPDSVSQNKYGEKMKFENCVKPRVSVRIPNHGRRSKKRLASASSDVVKLTKMPKLGIQEDSRHAVTALKTSPIFEPDVQCSREVLESAPAKHKAYTVESGKNAAQKDENKVCWGMAFNKLQGAPRSGPIKLTPGARYVLKPCQKKEQTNSKPSHSSIPFAKVATAERVLASEKSTKIYRNALLNPNFGAGHLPTWACNFTERVNWNTTCSAFDSGYLCS